MTPDARAALAEKLIDAVCIGNPVREAMLERVARILAQEEPPPPPDTERLAQQARDISEVLSDAGVGSCSIPEGVRQLIARADAAEARLRQLEQELRESNAVCACGCPDAAHENYGEDGQACEHDDHQCVPTNRAVLSMLTDLRAAHGRLRTALDSIGDRIGRIQNAARRIDDRRELRGMNYSDMTIIQGEAELIARELSQAALIPSPEEPHA